MSFLDCENEQPAALAHQHQRGDLRRPVGLSIQDLGSSPSVKKSAPNVKVTPLRSSRGLQPVHQNPESALDKLVSACSSALPEDDSLLMNASMFQVDKSLGASEWIENPLLRVSGLEQHTKRKPSSDDDVTPAGANDEEEALAIAKLDGELEGILALETEEDVREAPLSSETEARLADNVEPETPKDFTEAVPSTPQSSPSARETALLALHNLDTPPGLELKPALLTQLFAKAENESDASDDHVVRKLGLGLSVVAETAEENGEDDDDQDHEEAGSEVEGDEEAVEFSEKDLLNPRTNFKKFSKPLLLRLAVHLQSIARQSQLELSEMRSKYGVLRSEGHRLLTAYQSKAERLEIAKRERRTLVEQLTQQQDKEEVLIAETRAIEDEYDRLYESFTSFMSMFKEREAEAAKLQEERDALSAQLQALSSEVRPHSIIEAESDGLEGEVAQGFSVARHNEILSAAKASAANVESALRARIAALESELAAAHTEIRVQQVQRRAAERDAQEGLYMLREEHLAKIDEAMQLRKQLHAAMERAHVAEAAAQEAEHRALLAESRRDEAEWAYSDVAVSIEARETIIAHLRSELERTQHLLDVSQTELQKASQARCEAEEHLRATLKRHEQELAELEQRYMAGKYRERYLDLAEENAHLRADLYLAQAAADEAQHLVATAQTMHEQLQTRQKYIDNLYSSFDDTLRAARAANARFESVCNELAVCEKSLAECEETLSAKVNELDAMQTKCNDLTEKVAALEIALEDTRRELDAEQEAKCHLEEELAHCEAQLAELNAQVADRDAKIESFEAKISEMQAQLEERDTAIAERDTQIQRGKEQLRESEAALDAAQAGLQRADLDLAFLREEVSRRKERAAAAEAQVAALREELRHMREVKRVDEDEATMALQGLMDGTEPDGATSSLGVVTSSLRRNNSRNGSGHTISVNVHGLIDGKRSEPSPTSNGLAQIESLENELRAAKSDLSLAEQECAKLRAMAARAEGRASHAEEELERVQKKLAWNEESYKESFAAVATAQNEARQAKAEIERLEQELEAALQALSEQREAARVWKLEVAEANQEATTAIENLRAELATAQQLAGTLEKVNDELKQEIAALEANRDELKEQLMHTLNQQTKSAHAQESAASSQEELIRDLQTRLERRENELHTIRHKAKEYREAARAASGLKEELEACQAELQALRSQLRARDSEGGAVETTDNVLAVRRITELEAEVASLRKELAEAKSQSLDGDDTTETIRDPKERKIKQLTDQIEKLRAYLLEYKEQGDRKLHQLSSELQTEKDIRHSLARKITKIRDVIRKHEAVLNACNEPEITALVKVCVTSSNGNQ